MTTEPISPYAGTSGWSGSDTSRERAETEDANGTTSARQRRALAEVADHGIYGLTVKEFRDITGWHHGQASGSLSTLHKEGLLARLKERRNRCSVYVLPDDVRGRETAPHGRSKGNTGGDNTDARLEAIRELVREAEVKQTGVIYVHRLKAALDG